MKTWERLTYQINRKSGIDITDCWHKNSVKKKQPRLWRPPQKPEVIGSNSASFFKDIYLTGKHTMEIQ
jgi:hypothetical protein